ncbi:MAG: DUF2220 family protein [Bifidobacterium pseudolongum]|nr:DUF2220 family protein [Bifidobacterium pseudolongum]
MTTPADIAGAITRRVERRLYCTQENWPHAFPVRLGSQRALEADPITTFDADNAMRAWAERHGCRIETVTRRVGTPVDLVARVVVPDEATALHAAGREVRARRELVVARMRMVCARFGVDGTQAMAVVKMLSGESDVDFELFVRAAQWFATHRDLIAGMTAREVPLPGFSAKWLKASRSRRRRAICTLLGWSELPLRERPGELRYRYLDEACAAWPERLATAPVSAPETPIDTVLVVENKDTYQAIPAMPCTMGVFGSGFTVTRLRTLLPWCAGDGVRVVYWGDMDADGLEILARLRATGVACASLCMDRETYDAYGAIRHHIGCAWFADFAA